MTFRVTRNGEGSITAESDCPGNEVDHMYAQGHNRQLDNYMRENDQGSIDGRDYNDVVNRIVDERVRKYGGDPGAERMDVSTHLVW